MEHTPKARYVDFSPDEFIAGVSGKMTPEQIGVYWTICSLIYSKGGPIDNDPTWLGNIMGGVHWRTVRKVLNGLIKLGKVQAKDGQVWVQRCSTELAKTEHRISTARANGKQGGRPPKETNDIEEPDGSAEEKLTTNNQQPTTNHKKKNIHKKDFLKFWKAYPRKVSKPQAAKAYDKALNETDHETIMAGVDRYRNGKPEYG